MRLALISDIHGNCAALEAVLGHLSTQNVTQLICLGDVASTGPQPREVIKRLQEINCPVVMGNMDAWLLQPELKAQPDLRRQCWQDIDRWCAEQLSSVDQAYLHTFQPTSNILSLMKKYSSAIMVHLAPTRSVFCQLLQRRNWCKHLQAREGMSW